MTYIIRFDGKGYRVFDLQELVRYFHTAKRVERVLLTVETGESLGTNRQVRTFMELKLDEKDPNIFLTVTSDNKDWVDASFSAVHDVLLKYKNTNKWARSIWTRFGVQIVGVTLGFILSLWVAAKIAPRLAIENAFVIAFLFALLIFSNIWTYVSQKIVWVLNAAFPNVKFYRPGKERLHWLMQAIVGGVVLAITLYVLGHAASFLVDIVRGMMQKGA